jgi:hypothetical protein
VALVLATPTHTILHPICDYSNLKAVTDHNVHIFAEALLYVDWVKERAVAQHYFTALRKLKLRTDPGQSPRFGTPERVTHLDWKS